MALEFGRGFTYNRPLRLNLLDLDYELAEQLVSSLSAPRNPCRRHSSWLLEILKSVTAGRGGRALWVGDCTRDIRLGPALLPSVGPGIGDTQELERQRAGQRVPRWADATSACPLLPRTDVFSFLRRQRRPHTELALSQWQWCPLASGSPPGENQAQKDHSGQRPAFNALSSGFLWHK